MRNRNSFLLCRLTFMLKTDDLSSATTGFCYKYTVAYVLSLISHVVNKMRIMENERIHNIILENTKHKTLFSVNLFSLKFSHNSKSQIFVQKFNFYKILTSFSPQIFVANFLVKSKLSTAKKSKTRTFSRIFHQKKRQFSRESKLNFWTKNEDFE